eukprot:274725-Alexandrium_andersonii.AAC.1
MTRGRSRRPGKSRAQRGGPPDSCPRSGRPGKVRSAARSEPWDSRLNAARGAPGARSRGLTKLF